MMKTVTVYKVISDNHDSFMSKEAYLELRLQMSSGDFGSHQARALEIDCNQLEDLRWHSGRPFLDIYNDTETNETYFAFYDGQGDCEYEMIGA